MPIAAKRVKLTARRAVKRKVQPYKTTLSGSLSSIRKTIMKPTSQGVTQRVYWHTKVVPMNHSTDEGGLVYIPISFTYSVHDVVGDEVDTLAKVFEKYRITRTMAYLSFTGINMDGAPEQQQAQRTHFVPVYDDDTLAPVYKTIKNTPGAPHRTMTSYGKNYVMSYRPRPAYDANQNEQPQLVDKNKWFNTVTTQSVSPAPSAKMNQKYYGGHVAVTNLCGDSVWTDANRPSILVSYRTVVEFSGFKV